MFLVCSLSHFESLSSHLGPRTWPKRRLGFESCESASQWKSFIIYQDTPEQEINRIFLACFFRGFSSYRSADHYHIKGLLTGLLRPLKIPLGLISESALIIMRPIAPKTIYTCEFTLKFVNMINFNKCIDLISSTSLSIPLEI